MHASECIQVGRHLHCFMLSDRTVSQRGMSQRVWVWRVVRVVLLRVCNNATSVKS